MTGVGVAPLSFVGRQLSTGSNNNNSPVRTATTGPAITVTAIAATALHCPALHCLYAMVCYGLSPLPRATARTHHQDRSHPRHHCRHCTPLHCTLSVVVRCGLLG